jgi:hypothetical protein
MFPRNRCNAVNGLVNGLHAGAADPAIVTRRPLGDNAQMSLSRRTVVDPARLHKDHILTSCHGAAHAGRGANDDRCSVSLGNYSGEIGRENVPVRY